VLEPEDTTARTRNLQQTNTNGYKFQGTPAQFKEAQQIVARWGAGGSAYQPTPDCQLRLRQLIGKFKYRLDTNYAKMDRIVHTELEALKTKVMGTKVNGMTVRDWCRVLANENDNVIREAFQKHLDIKEADAEKLRK